MYDEVAEADQSKGESFRMSSEEGVRSTSVCTSLATVRQHHCSVGVQTDNCLFVVECFADVLKREYHQTGPIGTASADSAPQPENVDQHRTRDASTQTVLHVSLVKELPVSTNSLFLQGLSTLAICATDYCSLKLKKNRRKIPRDVCT